MLVIANEDYEGVNPTYPSTVTKPKYARTYVKRSSAPRASALRYGTSRSRACRIPSVSSSHFDAVVWYLGDNRLTQDPSDEFTDLLRQRVARCRSRRSAQQYLTMSVRDYLNDGGKLLYTGETSGYYGILGSALGGIYYGLNGAPDQDCVVTEDPYSDCLLLGRRLHPVLHGCLQPIYLRGARGRRPESAHR